MEAVRAGLKREKISAGGRFDWRVPLGKRMTMASRGKRAFGTARCSYAAAWVKRGEVGEATADSEGDNYNRRWPEIEAEDFEGFKVIAHVNAPTGRNGGQAGHFLESWPRGVHKGVPG